MLNAILKKLKVYPPVERFPEAEAVREAAVLIALTNESSPHLVLTQRAAHLNDHAGEVALPGGMWDREDGSLMNTVLRESYEEVSLHPEQVQIVSTLPCHLTRLGVPVTPFVGLIEPDVQMMPELAELDAIFRVPLDYLLNLDNLIYRDFQMMGDDYSMPCYHFNGFVIWGFTLGLLAEFLNHTLEAGIVLKYPDVPDLAKKIARFKYERDRRK